ncbi:MAG: TIGR04076 family protein [Desulfobulbaceae bacterium]|jgi:uncharacterized repeat protein (TIGR04076 family)|nr:TIGR04076 family protein [Desulfobulbaceae bacterium]
MKNWYKEDYSFKIAVISVGTNGKPENCRNGHEVGDTYVCEYGCPEGFCSKSMLKLFSLMEAVRAGGDLSNLLRGATKHEGEFTCSDGVVVFRLEAIKNDL